MDHEQKKKLDQTVFKVCQALSVFSLTGLYSGNQQRIKEELSQYVSFQFTSSN